MEGSLFLLLAAACLLVFVYHRLKARRFRALFAKLPGPPPLPLIGNAHELFVHPDDTFDRLLALLAKYGPLVGLQGMRFVVLVTEPKDVESILGNSKIINKDRIVSSIGENIAGPSVLTMPGDKWKLHQQLIKKLFHYRIMDSYVEVFGRKASILVDRLEKVADGRTFDVFSPLSMATLDAICATVIGVDMNTQVTGESKFGASLTRSFELGHERVVRPWLMVDWIYRFSSNARESALIKNEIQSFTSRIVDKKMAEYQAGKETGRTTTITGAKKVVPLSDLLIAASAEDDDVTLTKEEIRDELTAIAISGSDTTATTMSYALTLLAMHPKEQTAMVAELRDVFGSDDRAPTAQDIASLHGVRRVIKETMRLFPALALQTREVDEDTTLGSGYVLPAGCTAVVLPYVTQRMEAYWPNADAFVPDRWLPEASAGRHPYAYVPFSAGPRYCLGQKFALLQMTSILSSVVRRFEVSTRTGMQEFKKIRVSLTSRPVIGFPIQLKKRL